MCRRAGEDIYIPEYTGEADFVLVFQVCSVAPFKYRHADSIGAGGKVPCYVKFTGVVRHL